MNLHSKAGVSKSLVPPIVSIHTFLPKPALECNLSEMFLQTPALECIFGDTWSSDIFTSTSSVISFVIIVHCIVMLSLVVNSPL